MKEVFADTGYWIAMLHPKEQLHERALEVTQNLGEVRTVTSEMVLGELLAFFSNRGQQFRRLAVDMVWQLNRNPNVDIVPQTSLQFKDACQLYEDRLDKAWSLVDCSSFLIMRERGILEALAHDDHFKQASLIPLLAD